MTDNDAEQIIGYATAFDAYHRLGWPSVLPLARGTKSPPPAGYTGHYEAVPSYGDMMTWADSDDYRDGNLALRMVDMGGIDVDDYDGKTGGATLAEGEKRWGKLPPTYRSTSRSDGVSGIRLYRLPPGTRLREKITFPELGLGGVEILQHHHRYAVCWPSIHNKTGEMYRWICELDGSIIDHPPGYADIPELPQAWVEPLSEPEPPKHDGADLGSADATDILAACLTEGDMAQRVAFKLAQALTELYGPGNRHDAMVDRTLGLLRCGKQGESGVKVALQALRQAFGDVAEKTNREGGRAVAVAEFNPYGRPERTDSTSASGRAAVRSQLRRHSMDQDAGADSGRPNRQ